MTQYTERQGHGFAYEDEVIKRYNLEPELNYTSKWDAYFKGIPVSIKTCTRKGTVHMGDFYRNASLTHNFILIIGFWERDDLGEREYQDDLILYINKDFWLEQFPKKAVSSMRTVFDGITNSYEDDLKWKKRMNAYKKEWNSYQTGVIIHFKRDHKKQKRTQCSIKSEFLHNYLIPYYQVSLDEIHIK